MTTIHEVAEYVAREIAWNGSATIGWVRRALNRAGYDAEPAQLLDYGVQAGLLRYVPQLDSYTVTRKVNAQEFGAGFARWMAGDPA